MFDPLDFLAEVTQHIPDPGSHLVRYYGWYSSKTRGQRAQRQPRAAAGTAAPARPPSAREARQGWAALIKQVYETDPLICPKCGSEMKITAFIERHQTEVIEKLRCAKRTCILGKLTGRAWEAHSPTLRTVGREPGPRAAGDVGAGRGLNRRPRRKRGSCAQRCVERSAQGAGVSSTRVAAASQTPFEPSPSRGDLAAAFDCRPAGSRRPQQTLPGSMPADFTFISADGVSWAQPWPDQKPRGGLYSLNNAFYRTYQGAVYQSTDGTQWAVVPVPGKPDITGMCFGKGYYYVVANGRLQRTAAFSQWAEVPAFTTIELNAIAYGDDRFLAVGQHGVMFWSRDGLEWQDISRGSRMDLHGVTYHNGVYVAVGAGGTVLTSTDARRWEPHDPGTHDTLRSVTSADGVFVSVGDSGRLITSSSGVEWSSRFVPVFGGLLNVQFLNGSFYAVGAGGALLRSRDAHSWEFLPTGLTNDLQSICYQDGVYLVAARDHAVPIEGYCRLYQTTNFMSWLPSLLAVSPCPQVTASPSTVFNGNGFGPSLRHASYTSLAFDPPLGGWAPKANIAKLEGDTFVAFATTSTPIGAAYGWSIPDGGARVAPFQYVSPRPMRDVARGPQGFVAVGDGGEIRLGTLPRDGDAELPSPPARMEQTSATRWRLVTSGSSTFAVSVDASTSLTEWESVAGSGGWYADEVGASVELPRDLGFFRIVQMPIQPVPEAVPEPDERIGLLSVRPQPREWSVVRVDGETAFTATTQPSPRARLVSSNGVLYLQLGDFRLIPFCPSTSGFRVCDAPVESVMSTLVQSVIVGDAQTGAHVIVWRPEREASLLECRTAVWSNRQYAQRDPDTGISELKRALAFTGLYLHDLDGTPQAFDTAVTINMNPADGNVMDCEISGGVQFAGRIQDCGVDLISPLAVPSAELLQFSLRVGSGNAGCAFTIRRQGKLDCFIGMAVP